MADERQIVQVDLILRTLPQAAAWPPDWRERREGASYLYREGVVLTKVEDVPRVSAALRQVFSRDERATGSEIIPQEQAGGVVPLQLRVPGGQPGFRVPEVLDQLDRLVGPGVARPEHVLYVCGLLPCPATEPLEVMGGATEPTRDFPRPSRINCCCDHGGDGGSEHHGHPEADEQDCGCLKEGDGVGVLVAVVDTGFYPQAAADHTWLVGVDGEVDGGVANGVVGAYAGHGTFVAGCVRAVAPAAGVWVGSAMPNQKLDYVGAGAEYETEVLRSLDRLLDTVVPDVLVLTFASTTRNWDSMLSLDDIYERRLRHIKGLAVLAPAGNDQWSAPMWPASYPWVTSVGALDAQCAQRAYYSNWGSWVDVWAPGTDLVNAFVDGTYTYTEPPNLTRAPYTFTGMCEWSGTSFATPLVAGMVAARASALGMSPAIAVQQLLAEARSRPVPGVGAVLVPGQHDSGCCGCGCGHGGRHGRSCC